MDYQTPIGPHNGDTWEKLSHVCLSIRFLGEYIEVPGSSGDYGIDGFTTTGNIYQCYCPERECSDKDLYNSQRSKVHDDIEKLNKFKDELPKVFGGRKMKRWYLLTPKITDKNLLIYCNEKTSLVKSWNLSFIDDDFEVIPLDYKFLAKELEAALTTLDYGSLGKEVANKIELSVGEVKQTEISDYKKDVSNNEQTDNAMRKHTAMFPKNGQDYANTILKRVDRTVGDLLLGDYVLKNWDVLAQDQLERFNKVVKALEKQVEELCEVPSSNNSERYNEIKLLIKNVIDREFKSLAEVTRMHLADRVIADWLLRCPLNFE